MKKLEDISPSTLREVVELLRDQKIAKVRWSYIWYDDQADPDQIEFFDENGSSHYSPHTCAWVSTEIDHKLYNLSMSDFGDYELNVYTGEVDYIGGEPWRVPVSYGGPDRDDSDVSPIDEQDMDVCENCGYACKMDETLTDGLCDDCMKEMEDENED